jgi:hypothetical protein
MLTRLSERSDVAIALATGGWGESAKLKCRVAGLTIDRFAFASCDDSDAREEIMSIARARAAALNGIAGFDAFIYVGDGIWDWKASCRLGIPFIAIGDGSSVEILRQAGTIAFLPTYSDYSSFLGLIGLAPDGLPSCH